MMMTRNREVLHSEMGSIAILLRSIRCLFIVITIAAVIITSIAIIITSWVFQFTIFINPLGCPSDICPLRSTFLMLTKAK